MRHSVGCIFFFHWAALTDENEAIDVKTTSVFVTRTVGMKDPLTPPSGSRPLLSDDLRTTFFFLVFFHAAFFGTGNVASVSSFSLEAVLRLLPVFDPFSMGALLVLKIVVPFALLSAAFGVLTRVLRLDSAALFGIVTSTVDVMTLDFFYAVRNEGSWLDIGTSISCFVIASCFGILLLVLSAVAQVLVGDVNVRPPERVKDKPT
ncbi:MAG: Phosphatidylinositolglycan class N-domain-containing protein [Olpidium bornovanus]|uniref:GPI ethanolamine phosphate transferase 1 n=1 Tax=Olpidium bornovanus TaxID=278681 RepID=A0A8H8DMG3_9FUNG|nr:MAG: Phosphatidylinositolglycan class N-domain-containing protein [Olpidium bornovanus]